MYNKYSSIRKLRKPLILLLIFNTLYLSFYHYFGNNDSQLTLLNIPLDSTNLLAEYATTDANYTKEVDELIASIEPPIVTSEYRIPKRTNQIFQDPRLTFGLILNYVNQNPSSSIPFHWADWVDLSLLNNQLNKPIENVSSVWIFSTIFIYNLTRIGNCVEKTPVTLAALIVNC